MKKIRLFGGSASSVVVVVLLLEVWSILGMEVDLFVHKDKFGKSLTLDLGDKQCINVPRLWANLTMSVDTHGSCMQFYDAKSCKGRIAVIQPFHSVHQMDLSLINFHNAIQSISPCGAKVPSGRYVIQSAVDASILTVSKHETEFARVSTLPPQAFIPKAQQWEISEKHPNEYDIMPRIHETNFPVTYDGKAMKTGSFIRKVWKIESVGRGRYIIKSEWTQKCLYKTRIRTVEEHDCRAWSPNQEWVLRPLIAPTKPPPTADPQLADGVSFNVPSRVVDKYLYEQKRLREKEQNRRNKVQEKERDHNGAYLEPYRIRYKKTKPNKNDEDDDDDVNNNSGKRLRQSRPPGPEVMYTRPAPLFNYRPQPSQYGKQPGKYLAYMDGIAPIYEDAKVEDPTFPDFLLHAASNDDDDEDRKLPKYQVTRRPFRPQPTGHPDYIPDKKKYDGRVKDKDFDPDQEEEEENQDEESTEDENENNNEGGQQDQRQGPPVQQESEEESQEDETQKQQEQAEEASEEDDKVKLNHIVYESDQKYEAPYEGPAEDFYKDREDDKVKGQEEEETSQEDEKVKGDENNEEASQEDEESEPVGANDQEGGEASQEDQAQDEGVSAPEDNKAKKTLDSAEEGDDPARDVASFMKLLFQGINNKMNNKGSSQKKVVDLLEKRKKK